MLQAKRRLMAHDGAGSLRPTYSASPGCGTSAKGLNGFSFANASAWSRYVLPSIIDPIWASDVFTISRSAVVWKMTASSVSVRTVAACVPAGITTFVGCGAVSQNVSGAAAAVGGNSVTPSRSRNVTYWRSGTRLRR
jgi:hypothetical protein